MNIILLTQPGCLPCGIVKDRLVERGVDYTEIDVKARPEFVSKYGITSTPVIVVEDEHNNEVERVEGMKFKDINRIIKTKVGGK